MLTPLLLTSTLGTVCRKWRQHWAAACGASLVFILASGLAVSVGAVVETSHHRRHDRSRLGSPGGSGPADAARMARGTSLVRRTSGRDVVYRSGCGPVGGHTRGRLHDYPPAATGTSFTHVGDRWYDEPPAATTDTVGQDGFRAPDVPNAAAPNELRVFGR